MKKVLFGSTALVAAAAFAAPAAAQVELSTGGYMIVGLGFGEYASGGGGTEVEDSFHIIRDGEIQFDARGTLDNGISIQVRVELEAFNTGDQIDESYVAVSGTFGKILIGSNDTAYDAVGDGVGNLGSAYAMGSFDGSYNFSGVKVGSADFGSDEMSIQYYIPNISGFELGVSYTPTGDDGTQGGAIDTSSDTDNDDGLIAIGAEFSTDFENGSFTIGAGYMTDGENEKETWSVGAEVEFGNFTIGARYEHLDDTATGTTEQSFYGAGVIYATGPWEFGLNAAIQEVDSTVADSDIEHLRVNAGVTYELGDGVALGLGVDYGDRETESAVNDDLDGFGGALLLGISF